MIFPSAISSYSVPPRVSLRTVGDSASVACHDVLVVVESARKVRGSVLKPHQVRRIHASAYTRHEQRDDDATIRREEPNTASLIHEYSPRSTLVLGPALTPDTRFE